MADLSFPAESCVAVTKSDTTEVSFRFLYVGTGGDVAILPIGTSTAITFKNVPSGGYVYARCSKILSTGTTASDIVGCK